jgi:multiple sugar transport system substrate-binding protein
MNRAALRRARPGRKALGAVTATCLAASLGLGGGATAAAAASPVHLTFWSWVPGISASVNLWNKTHPNIQVNVDEVTSGTAGTYAKMFSALQAGNAPDLGQIEYDELPNFEHVGGVQDLSKYGANDVKKDFVSWTWAQVSLAGDVYAIPQDTGPMGLFYRADLFKKYGLQVPSTWGQYLADAKKLHQQDPGVYIAAFNPADPAQFAGLAQQAGANWFNTTSSSWLVDLADKASTKVASLWQTMINDKLVKVEPDFAAGWYKDLSDGTVLTWPTAVWGQNTIATNAATTSGDWRAAPLPTWGTKGSDGDWGGSTTVVFKGSSHPAQAAQFAEWLNTNPASITTLITKGGLYPADLAGEKQKVDNSPVAFYGGQNIWKVFQHGGTEVDTSFKWGPLMSTTFTEMGDAFTKATNGTGTLTSALSSAQAQTISTMKQQGISVKAG